MIRQTGNRRAQWPRLVPLLLAGAIGCTYANSFEGAFVLDDNSAIVDNPAIRRLVSPEVPRPLLARRGLVDLTFAVNHATGGLNPADYHATNLALHIAVALALYGVVRRTLRLPGAPARFRRRATPLAAVSALLWGVHPLASSAVTYVAQRYEVMMSFFFLLAFYALLRSAASTRPLGWGLVAWAAVMLGLLCKEVIVAAPALMIAFDRIFIERSWRAVVRRRGWLHLSLLAVWPSLFLLWTGGPDGRGGQLIGSDSPVRYGLTQAGVIAHYLRLVVDPGAMCLDYGWPVARSVRDVLPGGALVAALAAATIFGLARFPRTAFLGLGFFAVLAPSSSVAPRPDCAFDHRMYLALAPVVSAVVLGGCDLYCRGLAAARMSRRRRRAFATALRRAGIAIPLAAAVLLSAATVARNRVYRSEIEVWRDVVRKRPDNLRGHQNLATAAWAAGNHDEARAHCGEILRRVPDFVALGREALLARQGQPDGRDLFRQAYEWSGAMNTLGLVALAGRDHAEAARLLSASLSIAPGNRAAMANLAAALFGLGDRRAAIVWWRKLLALEPHDADSHRSLAEALFAGGNRAEAASHYALALKLKPDDAVSLYRLAWIRATSPDEGLRSGREARDLANRLLASGGVGNARAFDVAGAACAEAGDFAAAISLAERAVSNAVTDGERRAAMSRLDGYRRGVPFRDETDRQAGDRTP